jgi:Tol biopolymer transport system component
MHSHFAVALAAALSLPSPAAAQRASIPFVPHTDSAPHSPGFRYRSGETVIGWIDGDRTLLFSHVTLYSAGGDVIDARCEESGVFALDPRAGTIRKVYGFDRPPMASRGRQCTLIWADALNLGADNQLLYGFDGHESRVHALDVLTDSTMNIGPSCAYRVAGPRLSADRAMIVVTWGCGHPRGSTLLSIMRADGSNPHVLAPTDTAGAEEPSWSPDGRQIVYARNDGTAGESNPHIAIIDTSGTGLRTLAAGSSPEWSPTGEWIAYQPDSEKTPFIPAIHVVHPDGTADHAVYDARALCQCMPSHSQWSIPPRPSGHPQWSLPGRPSGPFRWTSDGRSIAFTAIFADGTVLESVDIQTGAVTQLTSVDGASAH